ncbi:SDR family NAD(P)-dependent oxidoreductase [Aestuariivirga sp.]|uniref:SDR family NAD(P)-dependent oxidoreductase n=1 Tax=Aestuariivirga sp. TaxID=2650926 RepID=UPI003783ECE6
MAKLLEGQAAFITGGAQGIGLAVARAMVAEGARVCIADVQQDTETTAATLGADALGLRLDVTDAVATDKAIETAARRFGRIDIAVPNAGILLLKTGTDMTPEEFRRVLDVNLTGAFITTRALGHHMMTDGKGGRIIMTSSLFGIRGGRENAAYSASKFGMIGMMQSFAAELAPHGILVNCVCPGQMDTQMIRQLFRERAQLRGISEAEVAAGLTSRIPVGHLGPMDHLAGTYLYLASDLSRYVTGQSIIVDGGWQVG